ncbi:MAG: sigma-54-dependent Fis family transcriptional regulator [Bacteroidetes bacterium]|nr:sigma-54-dependent Fis family transcriptional regulator [Bacteroidota bacterium]
MDKKILIVDDEEKIRKIVSLILKNEGYLIKSARDGQAACKVCEDYKPAVILMDQNMPKMNGIDAMEIIKEKHPQAVVIIITAFGEIGLAVNAIKKGAYDYIEKPFDNDKLILLINRAFEHYKIICENKFFKKKLVSNNSFDRIIAVSDKMKQVIEQAKSVCETNATVLIQGESGVGKEVIAKAIHYSSLRKDKPLIAINCGAIPITLIESELFGTEKGAFTDAKEQKKGKFEQANQGTLFLDELGELTLTAQVKLLRVLEEKKITRLGGKKSIPIDVRIISATNKNLEEKVQKKEFRLDLLYRLNIFVIEIPALRERKKDIPVLIELFIQRFNEEFRLNISNISKSTIEILTNYNWPGNIRELQNAIQSAMIIAKSGTITTEHIPLRIKGYDNSNIHELSKGRGLSENIKHLNIKAEKELIIEALKKCNFNRTQTADLLKISRKTLFNKMKIYNI